ncbi:MAG: hypothetical protein A3H42_02370 [Deltaproteobacteria bacterium RIFCSPLOWO2_02_FULL_46_8]|nr:MAG: hypothetical protein A3H42_02370 [Deltaproteobacteria bacterium RIFCSPLOWO2_02_FULL_46_8]
MKLSRYAKILGRKGGLKRAQKLSSARKKAIAVVGAKARAESLRAAKRIQENFLYLEAIREMAPPPKVRSLKKTRNKLPDIYG